MRLQKADEPGGTNPGQKGSRKGVVCCKSRVCITLQHTALFQRRGRDSLTACLRPIPDGCNYFDDNYLWPGCRTIRWRAGQQPGGATPQKCHKSERRGEVGIQALGLLRDHDGCPARHTEGLRSLLGDSGRRPAPSLRCHGDRSRTKGGSEAVPSSRTGSRAALVALFAGQGTQLALSTGRPLAVRALGGRAALFRPLGVSRASGRFVLAGHDSSLAAA